MSPTKFEVVVCDGDKAKRHWFQDQHEWEHVVKKLTLDASDYPPGTVIEVRLPEKGEEKG